MIAIELNNDSTPTFLPQFAALSQLHGVDVNSICRELGVEPVSSFLDKYKFDAGEGEDESTWYSAKEGARTFSALARHASRDFGGLKGVDLGRLKRELDDACKVLTEAVQTNTEFHLVIVIIPPGSEELVGL